MSDRLIVHQSWSTAPITVELRIEGRGLTPAEWELARLVIDAVEEFARALH